MIIHLNEAALRAKNAANMQAIGRRNIKKVSFPLFTNIENASWATQMVLAEESNPPINISLPLGRKAFQLKPGNVFLLTYPPHNIENMVVRVVSIEEENLESERLNLTVVEDINYTLAIPGVISSVGKAGIGNFDVSDIEHFRVIEPPYITGERPSTVLPLVSRVGGQETGAIVFISIDGGTSYETLGSGSHFSVHGVLTSTLTVSGTSFMAEIEMDASNLESDVSAHTKKSNLILINDETISFTTITPQTGDIYEFSGLLRGVYDTTQAEHAIGDDMFSLDGLSPVSTALLTAGNTYYFKAVPFNNVSIGDVADSLEVSLAFRNLSLCPRTVIDLKANGDSAGATYTTTIALTWSPRVRWSDEIPVELWECDGLFEVQVWVSGSMVRSEKTTSSNKFFDEWEYTEAMNEEDNTTLASTVILKVYNFINTDRYSDVTEISVSIV